MFTGRAYDWVRQRTIVWDSIISKTGVIKEIRWSYVTYRAEKRTVVVAYVYKYDCL